MTSPASTSGRSALSRVAIERRRRAAATLGLFSILFVAIAAVAATGATNAALTVFVVVAGVMAVLLGLIAWGVASSVRADTRGAADRQIDADLDAAIEQAVAARGETMCGCGHEHDPSELHVPDDPCGRDGHGVGCTHSCQDCVLATLKRTSERGTSTRPSPTRRPSPVPR